MVRESTIDSAKVSDHSSGGGPAFGLLGLVQVTLIASMTVIAVALPSIQQDLDASTTGLALVNNAYAVSFCGLLLFGGQLGDLYGYRRMFSIGTAIFGVACAAASFAPLLPILVVARFGQGIGAALAAPAAMALLGAVFPEPGRRRRALAIWGGLPVAGATTGLLVSGVIVAWTSWRWGFLPPALIALLAVACARRVLPHTHAARCQRIDMAGAVLVPTGLAGLCFGFLWAGEQSWRSWPTVLALAVGVGALMSFTLLQRRNTHPLLPLSFLLSARRITGLLAVLLASTGTFTTTFFLPLYFQEVRGYSPLATSAAFLPFAAAMFTAGWLAGRLASRFSLCTILVTGLGTGAAGLGLLGLLQTHSPYLGPLLAGLVIFPLGVSLVFSAATTGVVEHAPAEQAGLAGGVLNTAMEGGPALGFSVLVSLAAARSQQLLASGAPHDAAVAGGYGSSFVAAALCFAALILVAVVTFGPQVTR